VLFSDEKLELKIK